MILSEHGSAIPFNPHFFHDDYDDGPGFDDIDEGSSGGISANPEERDLLAPLNGGSRRVRPQYVNYANRAKRVDVRKLKDNIWKGLNIVIPEPKEEESMVCNLPLSKIATEFLWVSRKRMNFQN